MRDPNRDYHGEDWESLPIAWGSPYVSATADMAQKVREFLATCRGESNSGDDTERKTTVLKVSIGRYMMEGVNTVPDEPSPDVIIDVDCSSGGVRIHGVKTETGGYEFKRIVVDYIDSGPVSEYEDPLSVAFRTRRKHGRASARTKALARGRSFSQARSSSPAAEKRSSWRLGRFFL